ncbi:unnamed protein product (macronuclear) [Paramecium tetraurelia]|uniref:Uncharacterized protein n=1 Tax=Paramecium tetraurelia TaxID=5888 RepID=A0C9U5_PARTE|nr:uncharacterized protein GSPATT00006869001 [Paramecium tetraurelia]CAK67562.1 unnamed protein product [Paramecium tetraurelia]|eukprot:XP_001434959.1 hypothetical protein (macronuclear) [Paramecium tetraurelia strain d4-2]
MEEKTMQMTKLKIELNAQKQQQQVRLKTFENHRELRAKLEYDDLIKDFEEQCNVLDEQYAEFQLDEKAKEEQEYNSEVYEKSMLANLDNINFEAPEAVEEEFN